jgi:multidrug resistance efflux pump
LQQTIATHCEDITQLNRSTEEMKESWNRMTTTNSALRAQLNLAESTFTSEQRDASTRLQEDLGLRSELSECLSRETVWKQELQAAKLDMQQFSSEAAQGSCHPGSKGLGRL